LRQAICPIDEPGASSVEPCTEWKVARAHSDPRNDTKEKRRPLKGAAALPPQPEPLVQVVRNVIEGRVELVADALHCADRRNGNQRGDEAILDSRRALDILQKLQKFRHFRSPTPFAQNAHRFRTRAIQASLGRC